MQNLAAALFDMGDREEAEALLRRAMETDRTYVFARASLVKILLLRGDVAGAGEVLRGLAPPRTIHPDAYLAWMEAQATLDLARGDLRAARATLDRLDAPRSRKRPARSGRR